MTMAVSVSVAKRNCHLYVGVCVSDIVRVCCFDFLCILRTVLVYLCTSTHTYSSALERMRTGK